METSSFGGDSGRDATAATGGGSSSSKTTEEGTPTVAAFHSHLSPSSSPEHQLVLGDGGADAQFSDLDALLMSIPDELCGLGGSTVGLDTTTTNTTTKNEGEGNGGNDDGDAMDMMLMTAMPSTTTNTTAPSTVMNGTNEASLPNASPSFLATLSANDPTTASPNFMAMGPPRAFALEAPPTLPSASAPMPGPLSGAPLQQPVLPPQSSGTGSATANPMMNGRPCPTSNTSAWMPSFLASSETIAADMTVSHHDHQPQQQPMVPHSSIKPRSTASRKHPRSSRTAKTATTGNAAPYSQQQQKQPHPTTTTRASTCAISEDESEIVKRRQDRNSREQARAHQITEQISHLRKVLLDNQIVSKPDKFSTLVTIQNYIRQLQQDAKELADQHQKLLQTLQQTTERVNQQQVQLPSSQSVPTARVSMGSAPSSDDGRPSSDTCSSHWNATSAGASAADPLDGVPDLTYQWIFQSSPIAFGITSIDGRFRDCNQGLCDFVGYTRQELLPCHYQQGSDDKNGKDDTAKDTPDAKKEEEASQSATSSTVDETPGPTEKASPTTEPAKPQQNMSLFNILDRAHIEPLFCTMSKMLQFNDDDSETDDGSKSTDRFKDTTTNSTDVGDTYQTDVALCQRTHQRKANMRVSLVRSSTGLPRFFNLVLLPVTDNVEENNHDSTAKRITNPMVTA